MLLLAGIGWLFCTLFFGDSAENAGTDRLTDGVEAVPSDAIFLFEAASLSDAAEFVDGGSALGRLLECIPDHASEWEAALSMHYSTKNEVSPLLVVSIPEDEDAEALMDRILQKCGGVVDKRYGSVTVHKSAVPDASFAEYGSFLIASPSLVIVEASLRHLENGTSIKDNPLYSRISGVSSERGVLHVNFSNLGKLFSGAAARGYVGYASFFQAFADWGAFGEGSSDSPKTFDGRVMSVRTGDKFSDVLLTQRGRKPEVYSVVPYSASWVLTLPVTSYPDYMKAYSTFIAADGRKKDYDYVNALAVSGNGGRSTYDFVESLGISEVAVFSSVFGNSGEKRILAMRCSDPAAAGEHSGGDPALAWQRRKGACDPAVLYASFKRRAAGRGGAWLRLLHGRRAGDPERSPPALYSAGAAPDDAQRAGLEKESSVFPGGVSFHSGDQPAAGSDGMKKAFQIRGAALRTGADFPGRF